MLNRSFSTVLKSFSGADNLADQPTQFRQLDADFQSNLGVKSKTCRLGYY